MALSLSCSSVVLRFANEPDKLDLIPDDAVAALCVGPLGDLEKKLDQLATDQVKLNQHLPSSQDVEFLLQILQLRGGFDYQKPAALVLANPKCIGANNPENQELLVLVVPFVDRGKMAGNFGFTAETLKPDQTVELKVKHVGRVFRQVCPRAWKLLVSWRQ